MADAVDRLVERLVSPKVGVIRSIVPQPRDVDEPVPPYLRVATLAHFDFVAADESDRIGAGKGLTDADAIAASIGEAAERYCAYQWDAARVWTASRDEISGAAIDPAELVLYSDEQYRRPGWPFVRWDTTNQISWIQAVSLPSGEPVAVPASLVYLVQPPPRVEDQLTAPNSNGLSAGPTVDSARLGGLCEVIERDAFMLSWFNRLPAVEVDLGAVDDVAANVVRRYRRSGVTVRAHILTSDLPATTVLAVAFDDAPDRPAQVVALGCHPSPRVALRKALFELCQARPSESRRFRQSSPIGRLERYSDVTTLDDHSAFASHPDRRHEFDFLSSGEVVRIDDVADRSLGDPAADLVACSTALAGAGHPVAAVDITLEDIASCGLHVTRVLVGGLQPIHFGHGRERLGGSRLFASAGRSGGRAATADDLNPCPHPLA